MLNVYFDLPLIGSWNPFGWYDLLSLSLPECLWSSPHWVFKSNMLIWLTWSPPHWALKSFWVDMTYLVRLCLSAFGLSLIESSNPRCWYDLLSLSLPECLRSPPHGVFKSTMLVLGCFWWRWDSKSDCWRMIIRWRCCGAAAEDQRR